MKAVVKGDYDARVERDIRLIFFMIDLKIIFSITYFFAMICGLVFRYFILKLLIIMSKFFLITTSYSNYR